jgi:uncharacterized protein (UPF0332 family)
MMIIPFEVFVREGKVKKRSCDPEMALSLIGKARMRLEYASEKPIKKSIASFVLEDGYEAIREAAQALMSLRGYKPYSHEATVSFLKEFYSAEFSEHEIRGFDRFRVMRNNSVYNAVLVSVKNARDCLDLAEIFVEKIASILE